MKTRHLVKALLRNPFTIWINWLVKKMIVEHRFKGKRLSVGYMAKASNCNFGEYNTLYDRVLLNNVVLGDFTYVANDSVLTNTTVGKFSCIGPEVICGLGKHPTRDHVSVHPAFFSPIGQAQIAFATETYFEEYAPIDIGNDVWIGARATVLDGVRIGSGAIVGAGAIVTKDVPDYAVVGGVPAKILRYRFEPAEIEFLVELQWWNKEVHWLRDNHRLFHDIKSLRSALGQRSQE
jgi:acetyltransferase-like isoleucine patch superfamily enzyme